MNFAQIAAERADEIAAIDPANLGPIDPIVEATTVAAATSAYDAASAIAAATSAVASAVVEKRSAATDCPTIYTGYVSPLITPSVTQNLQSPVMALSLPLARASGFLMLP